jgi:two-component system osmolarity sensor histidine kinase EnvZ
MFYGLNKFIKNILPKKLFYRSLLIVTTPILILQITISVVFFDSLWIKTNKGMTRSLVSEIYTFIVAYKNEKNYNKQDLTDLYYQNFDLNIKFLENQTIPNIQEERWFSPIDRTLRRELKLKFVDYWFDSTSYKDTIVLKINHYNGVLQFLIPKTRVTNSSARIFALWITLPAFLLIFIAMVFLKNQTRPIINLAKAAERFGKGEIVQEFRPSGAMEIRMAAYEFDRMRKRITKQLTQRSEMLSGISHDLRTPLTRLKLQLAFLNDKKISKKMSEDIDEMEKMLNEYLQFSKSQFKENYETFLINDLLKSIINKYNNNKIKLSVQKKIYFDGRVNSLKRCIGNLIDNALKYGTNVEVTLNKSISNINISIDDDGPGIPKDERLNVLKPFYKVDKSRNETKSSVGLGLSIASDIIKSHGGNILLETSPKNGLRVKISLPF